jgi:mycofactocin system glycosyltransferase
VTPPLPIGLSVVADPGTAEIADGILFGGSPARVLRLTPTGRAAWRELADGPVASRAAGVLARRLTDAGLAHPVPATPTERPDVTVVIPVRDRTAMLDRCLAALGSVHHVVVVDDASRDPAAIAEVTVGHGATLLRRDTNGGPGPARNTTLTEVRTELVAFIDSDCVPSDGWIERLAAHFADPAVAAVAPRVVALPGAGKDTGSGLDLGDQQARVGPNTRVSYVPTAALVARRCALLAVARDGAVFDPALRTGEDVDLVWRLHEAGWRVRYDPAVRVEHDEPDTTAALLARRFRYGTSAAPLAVRHPTSVPPLVLHPWPSLTVAALLARRPVLAGAAFAASVLTMISTLRRASVPSTGVVRPMAFAVWQTWLGIGRYATQFASPVLAALLVAPGGRTAARHWGRRAAVASLLLGPALTASAKKRRVRAVLDTLADDIAYGSGVWAGCLAERTTVPVRPVIAWHPLRIESPATRPNDTRGA